MKIDGYVLELLPISIHSGISDVLDKFRRHTELTFIPIVNEYQEPLGIVRETSLRTYTHARFGRELIQKHKTAEFLSFCPTILMSTKFQELILTSTFSQRKEGFLVVKDGKYAGFLHTHTLIDLYEEHRLDTQQQLLQTQKMESIGNLAGGIAHDFNNILASITGHLTMIKMRLKLEPEDNVNRYLATIGELCNKASNLTKQLLGFARGGKYRVEPLNFNEVIEHVVSILTDTFPRDIEFIKNLSPGLSIIEADRGQLEQVLMNLFINSRDAMPNGGQITINTSNVNSAVEISIEDTGNGIPAEIQKRIFEPFFTTKERGKGTGMGLAMVYGIIRNHGGHINLESEVNKGTRFKIYLPRSGSKFLEKTMSIDIIPRLINEEFKDLNVMVVDDDHDLIEVIEMYLGEIDCKSKLFSKGSDAIAFYSTSFNEVDVVLLDMIMPEMSGQQVYNILKKYNNDLVVIFMSGYNTNESMQSILSLTKADFLQKPFTFEQLRKSLSNCLAVA